MRKTMGNVLLMLIFSNFLACSQSEDESEPIVPDANRVISFSGFDWVVRNSEEAKEGPGPNIFSDSEQNVWVDDQGRLHLKITNQNGVWHCAGLALHRSYGFNRYVVYISSRVDQLDDNVVAGVFIYNNDQEEIDIEFSRWAVKENRNAQFAVQPSARSTNKYRFDLNLQNDLSTHFIDWKPESIKFGSFAGHTTDVAALNHSWIYEGDDIPPDNEERLKINLWLFRGKPPLQNIEDEIIIDRIEIL
ncbi:family 16 glycosylhydrolase [Pseudozobellia sp. WGM2]|uniref:family 16 glycosylhydrolase n=1 Tax=Pseudozobellia sp. WGM2 TaxID=2787625 RepID=UPI001AE02BD9|nr:family 16 glycosylhydrolase [Pseudozobellia sp. WGM2]